MGRTQTRTCHMPCQHIQGTYMTPIESIVTLVHLSTEHSSTLAWGLSKDQKIWQSGLSTINTGNKLCRTGSSALECRMNAEYQRIRQAANCASVIMATGSESEFQHQESRAHHCHKMDLEPTPLMVQWNLKNHIGTTKELKRSVTISLISGSARSSWSLVMSSRPQRNRWCHKNYKRTS